MRPAEKFPGLSADVGGVLCLAMAGMLGMSLLTHRIEDASFTTVTADPLIQNAIGRVGAVLSDLLFQTWGLAACMIPIIFLGAGGWMLSTHTLSPPQRVSWGVLTLLITVSALWASVFQTHEITGGVVGTWTADMLVHYFSVWGRTLTLLTGLGIGLLLICPISLQTIVKKSVGGIQSAYQACIRQNASPIPEACSQPPPSPQPVTPVILNDTILEEALLTDIPPEPLLLSAPRAKVTTHPSIYPPVMEQEALLPDREPIPQGYQLPPLSLLAETSKPALSFSEGEWQAKSRLLEQKLLDFDISGRIVEIHPGPVITMFEFEPAPGIKISRITPLADDLALAMKALRVRIVAPLPWKSTVGIEVPNTKREEVLLKSILSSVLYTQYSSKTRLALGKDIKGQPVSADLASMPHLLIAGATGSGKSVGMNAMILSILFSATPAEVKMIMIDPKMLEFSLYDGIPHLMAPVIVRPKRAAAVLQQMVMEMQRRYELLAEKGVRNIDAYNQHIQETGEQTSPLPYIIIFVDELADLMMVSARDVEDAITRLAQMARAAGIHLVLATQRPSVDVITGLIKANFPARIAYRVASKVDSRTILDANGAEQLLGEGDMLYLAAGSGQPMRIHGAYVSEREVKRVVAFIRSQAQPVYGTLLSDDALATYQESQAASAEDKVYQAAKELVIATRQASASWIQRRLRVGYPRAARMIEMMEEEGIVGPAMGAKPREVLVPKDAVTGHTPTSLM